MKIVSQEEMGKIAAALEGSMGGGCKWTWGEGWDKGNWDKQNGELNVINVCRNWANDILIFALMKTKHTRDGVFKSTVVNFSESLHES